MRGLLFLAAALALCACRFNPQGVAAADAATPPTDAANPIDAIGTPDAMTTPDATLAPDAMTPDPLFCDPANPDLVACYRFDDSTGQDASQYANHLTASNVMYVPGYAGMAMRTDTSSDVKAAESASLDVTAATMELWVNPASLPQSGRVGLIDNNNQYGFFILAGGILRCSGGGALEVSHTLVLDQWTHLACTNDGSQIAIWVNGVMMGAMAGAAMSQGGTEGTALAMNNPSGDNFSGLLDDVRIWRVIRSASDICAAAGAACSSSQRGR